jgi:6-phosphogluconolactonase
LFAALRGLSIPWQNVVVTLCDERWVDPASGDSNENLVRSELLQGVASAARFVPLKTPHDTPEEAEPQCAEDLSSLPALLDIVVLGMGLDGHTASWFPRAPTLDAALDPNTSSPCLAVRPPDAPYPRMTLSLTRILACRRLVLHITGDEKWQVYREARNGDPAQTRPISLALSQESVPVEVYWAP